MNVKHSRAAYLVNNAAVRVECESVLHEVAARLPRRRRPPGPGRTENAVGDDDGVGAGEPHDPHRCRAAAEWGDDGRDGTGSAAPASAAVVRPQLAWEARGRGRGRGRALVPREDEGVRARGQSSGATRV